MATDPRNRVITAHYPGGAVVAPQGLIQDVFQGLEARWTPRDIPGSTRKRKWGTSQRSNARAGRVHYLVLNDGTQWSVRVIGSTDRFIEACLANMEAGRIERIYTQSGTKYGPDYFRLV